MVESWKQLELGFKTSSKLDRNKIKYYQRFQNLNGSIDIYCKKFLSTHLLQLRIHHRFRRNICVYASGYWYSLNKSKSLNMFLVLGKDKTPPTSFISSKTAKKTRKGKLVLFVSRYYTIKCMKFMPFRSITSLTIITKMFSAPGLTPITPNCSISITTRENLIYLFQLMNLNPKKMILHSNKNNSRLHHSHIEVCSL